LRLALADLTALNRSEQIARWAELASAKGAQVAPLVAGKSARLIGTLAARLAVSWLSYVVFRIRRGNGKGERCRVVHRNLADEPLTGTSDGSKGNAGNSKLCMFINSLIESIPGREDSMRDNSFDRTIERNYIQKWRFLIAEYEEVKAGRSPTFRRVGDFYKHHGTCSQTFRKYYNRYLRN